MIPTLFDRQRMGTSMRPARRSVTGRWTLLMLAFLSTTAAVRTAAAQLVFQVCHETCPDPLRDPGGAAACHARIAECESKLTAYNAYMAQLGAGTTTYALPAKYRELLQPFYSSNLSTWRFAFGDRQPPGNATTDCTVTYFNRANFVLLLRKGELDGLWGWLFHELQHFNQCQRGGTRDAYAKMWFGNLALAFIQNNDLATLHNRMPMESDANAAATRVLLSTEHMFDSRNHLVAPIAVVLSGASGQVLTDQIAARVGDVQHYTAKVTGGSDPLERIWTWRVPGSTILQSAPSNVVDGGNGFQFTPTAVGTYYVRARVRQPDSPLADAIKQVRVDVLPALAPRRF